jgi:hypothetical protein
MKSRARAACVSIAFAVLVIPILSQGVHALEELPTGITLFTEEKRYVAGERVHLMAQLHEQAASNTLAIFTVFAPDNEKFLTSKQVIQGNFLDFAFSLDEDETRTGEWTVNVRYLDVDEDATFVLLDKGLYDRALLDSPVLKDSRGEEVALEDVKAGADLTITASLENDEDESRPYAFVAQVLDGDGLPVFVSISMGTLSPGQTASPAVNWKPAQSGTYTVEVFAWNSLSDPMPLDDKRSGTFEVY